MTPTARTLRYLRDLGHVAGVVERFNPHTRTRHDLFGFIDVVSVHDGRVYGWQATSGSNVSSRAGKVAASPLLPAVASAMSVAVIGWRKLKVKRGGRAVRWTPRIVPCVGSVERPAAGCGASLSRPVAGVGGDDA